MLAKSPEREGKREPGTQVQKEANRYFLKSGKWNQKLTTSKVELMPKAVRRQNQTGADPPKEAIEMVNSQRAHVGVVKVVKSVEEEKNVTIVSLVVSLNM